MTKSWFLRDCARILPHSAGTADRMTLTHRNYTLRKQDHGDFSRRVKRIDPAFYRTGRSSYVAQDAKRHVIGAALIGFGWAYGVAAIGNGRGQIESSLRQGTLSPEVQHWILSALAAMLAASLVMLVVHLLRMFISKGPRRSNSRALLTGAVLAFAVFHMPQEAWNAGYSLLDGRSQDFLASASAMVETRFPSLQIGSVSFASSLGF